MRNKFFKKILATLFVLFSGPLVVGSLIALYRLSCIFFWLGFEMCGDSLNMAGLLSVVVELIVVFAVLWVTAEEDKDKDSRENLF